MKDPHGCPQQRVETVLMSRVRGKPGVEDLVREISTVAVRHLTLRRVNREVIEMVDGGVVRTALPLPPVDPASVVEADAAPAPAVALRVRGREIPPLVLQPGRAAHLMGFFPGGDRTGKGHAG